MMNLAEEGENSYNVPTSKSFIFGVNHSLDWYNKRKIPNIDTYTKYYALCQGAKAIINYSGNTVDQYKFLQEE